MMMNEFRARRFAWVVGASLAALLLALGVVLVLTERQAMAKPLDAIAAVQINKEVNAIEAQPGDTLYYTITVENTALFSNVDVQLTDTLPAELTLVGPPSSDIGPAPVVDDGVITWEHELESGAEADITFQAQITTAIQYATIVNTAEVTGNGELLESSATTAAFIDMGDLDNALTAKRASASKIAPGGTVVYTVTLKNSEPDPVYDASFTDTLPVGLTYDEGSLLWNPAQGDAVHSGGVITWQGTLGGNATAAVRFAAITSSGLPDGWITNTVDIASPIQTFTREAGVHVKEPRGVLEAVKTVDPSGTVHASEELSYTVVISNSGDAAVTSAEMADVLPGDLNYVAGSVSATSGSAGEAGGTVSWSGSLAPAQRVEVRFAAKMASSVDNGQLIVNTANITGAGTLVTAEIGFTTSTTYTYHFPFSVRYFPPGLVLDPIPTPDAEHKFTVSWQQPDYAVSSYTLQMARDRIFTNIRSSWTPTGLSQEVYSYCAYYFRVRAENPGAYGHGSWSNAEQGHFSPPTPTLDPIPEPAAGQYTVSWSAIPALDGWEGLEHYVLEESDDAGFGTIARSWETGNTSQLVSEPAEGTWHYRVRADDSDCWGDGPWSNVEIMSNVDMYYDDFSDDTSGWRIRHKTVIPDTNSKYHTHYQERDGEYYYRIRIDPGGPPIWFHQPASVAPYIVETDKYCVETEVRLYKMRDPYDNNDWDYYPYWANGGLIFGAVGEGDDVQNLYALCTSVGSEDLGNNIMGWFVVHNPTYNYPKKGCNYQDGVVGGQDAGALNVKRWHLFQVSVDGNDVDIYINGTHKASWNMPGLRDTNRVGLVGGSYEIQPVDYWFKWLRVIPNAECEVASPTVDPKDVIYENEPFEGLGVRMW